MYINKISISTELIEYRRSIYYYIDDCYKIINETAKKIDDNNKQIYNFADNTIKQNYFIVNFRSVVGIIRIIHECCFVSYREFISNDILNINQIINNILFDHKTNKLYQLEAFDKNASMLSNMIDYTGISNMIDIKLDKYYYQHKLNNIENFYKFIVSLKNFIELILLNINFITDLMTIFYIHDICLKIQALIQENNCNADNFARKMNSVDKIGRYMMDISYYFLEISDDYFVSITKHLCKKKAKTAKDHLDFFPESRAMLLITWSARAVWESTQSFIPEAKQCCEKILADFSS
jgi:hypothetical protein